ncbi:MAG: hypothetical protein ACRDJ4_02315 [Actinomycetota bacterium]
MRSWRWWPSDEQIALLGEFRMATGRQYAISASTFVEFVGEDSLVEEQQVIEFLWGYAPLYGRSRREPPDELRFEIADLIRFLAARSGWDPRPALAICEQEETFRHRWNGLRSTPSTLWLEELRTMLALRGLPSTIPPADPQDPFGHALRERIQPGRFPLLSPPLPPAGDPTKEMEQMAAASPAMRGVSSLIEIVGAGAKLTAKGNLGLAQGRALADAMGFGDLFDQRFVGKVFKTRSSSEVEPVDLVFRCARAAGLVRSQHGKLIPTQRGRGLGRQPMEGWWALFRVAVLKLDWAKARYPKDRIPFWADLVCECIPAYLRCAHDAGARGLALLPLAEATWRHVEERWVTEGMSDEEIAWQKCPIRWAIHRGLFVPLELLGCAETWTGAADGAVRVSPLGVWALRRLGEEEGGSPGGRSERPAGVIVLDDGRRNRRR